ncbi:MAG: Trk family potassium uptake protein [Selenomonadaceae bacterium]|nr:Trk family potassium uptake protein [Selenomonadaceae bacterium]MBQ3727120.1 Trk family potassium uptake protein [Selenomonadaceae bacterium]
MTRSLEQLFRFKPTQIILLSFLFMILLGTALLMLPISTTNHQGLAWIDALFVSTSASCVTGLTVVDLHNDLTTFGTIVMLMLIQVGGLGIMTLATLAVHTMGYRFRLRESLVLQESLNQGGQAGLMELIRRMIKYTLTIEFFFAVVLAAHFYPEFGWKAVGYGIFHSVSAFCNAGFDLFGNYDSLCKRNEDFFLMACIALLIILGGIGFTVMNDVINKKFWRQYSLHTKIVIVMNLALIFVGTILLFGVEYYNPSTVGNLSIPAQLANACFTSVSCRTAGFNSYDLAQAEQISQLVMIILMFIGASPLSTGGGIKATTFFVILQSMWAVFRGKSEITIFGRKISRELRDQAFAIFTMGTIWVVTAGIILSAIDGEVHELEEVIFETVSGFGTVGMGIGITLQWSMWGKLVLALTMFVGRVGIMTFMLSLLAQKETRIKYPKEDIMIG